MNNHQTPKVSVLIPCYNVERYVSQCLSSVCIQTLKDIEIICIDDGSSDTTLQILKEYQGQDPRIKLISKPNSGYGDSMNRGLEIAKGEYIGIVESDDFIEPNMFEILYSNAKQFNLEISRACYFEYTEKQENLATNEFVKKEVLINPNKDPSPFWQAPAIWASIYQNSWLKQNNIRFLPTPGASYQDTSFAFKAYACCNRFYMSKLGLLHYRMDNSNSSINSSTKAFCVCEEWNEIYRFVRSDLQRFGHLIPILPLLQYGTYKWNYSRLSGKLKKQFLLKWIKELFHHFQKGEIVFSAIFPEIKTRIKRRMVRRLCKNP